MKTIGLKISRIVLALFAISNVSAQAQLPISGRPVAGMTAFDTIMTGFMGSNGITAGVLGISRTGRIEYLRAFGWLTPPAGGNPGVPLPENALMRTASTVKPVTAAAIRQFAAEGGFDRNTDPPGDVMFKSRDVAAALGITSPPSNRDTISYMLGQSLQWTPGTVSNLNNPPGTDAYSNYGYMVLGEILQAFAPGGYLGYVQNKIMSPARGIPATEFVLARSLVVDRRPREPGYIKSNDGDSVFDNTPPIDTVPMPDGGFYIEGMLAHGGVIASAEAMIGFANAFHVWCVRLDAPEGLARLGP